MKTQIAVANVFVVLAAWYMTGSLLAGMFAGLVVLIIEGLVLLATRK